MSCAALRRIRGTLSFRLTLWYSGLFCLSTVLLFGVTYLLLARSLQRRDYKELRGALTEYRSTYQRGGLTAVAAEVAERGGQTEQLRLLVRVATATSTTLLLESPPLWKRRFAVTQLETQTIPDEKQLLRIPTTNGDEDILEVASVHLPDGRLLQVGKSTHEREELLEQFQGIFIGVMGPILLVSVAGGTVLTWRALHPLRGLTHTLHAIITTGALATRARVPSTEDELAELSRLFNSMLERISLLISGMQSTLDNVSHDLRTPMTRLRGMAEMVLQTETSETGLREALVNCIEESDRILTMLTTLMDISEAEHGAMKLAKEPVSADDLITQAVDLYHDVAEEKAIQLITSVSSEVGFCADRNRMLQVLTNLLDNALKYTSTGGRVTITAARDGQHFLLIITDTGVGIPPEDLPHIWDRLYRGDKSRSQRGLGLGLSVVKAIVHAHHGSVQVQSTPGSGSTFTLSLPLVALLSS